MPARSLLQVAEVWVPESGGRLRLHAGSYGTHPELRSARAEASVGLNEGLAGRVQATGMPLVINHFAGESSRTELAHVAGLTAALGFPLVSDRELKAVVLLFCGSPADGGGALEVWAPSGAAQELYLHSGYYGRHDDFRRLSALLRFPPEVGLPGRVWASGDAAIMDDLGTSSAFLRSLAARTIGLEMGLGLPVFRQGAVGSVVAMLSGRGPPLARAFEIWRPNPDGARLSLGEGAYPGMPAFAEHSRGVTMGPGEGLPGRVWATKLPWVLDELSPADFVRAEAAREAELTWGVGIPILRDDQVQSVVVLLS